MGTKELASEWRKRMQRMNAPCRYFTADEKTGKVSDAYPHINCDFKCDSCGWNPAEKKRRLEQGEFKPVTSRMSWNEDTGTVSEIPLPEGTEQLVFKSVRKEEESVVQRENDGMEQ